MKGWGSKAWDGCLQVRAINVLHSTCVSDYYHYYYQYYYFYFYYYYYYCCCCYSSTQESSNHKACADWPILRSTRRSDYLITGRARAHAKEERKPPLFFSPRASSTFLLSLPQKGYDCYDEGDYSGTFMRASKFGKNLAGRDQVSGGGGGGGGGDKRSFVLQWFF